jgi:nucleoside-diphosphate-sugar epimerase
MKCIVTGAAGFIGAHLSEKLLSLNHSVTGIDCFTDYYPRALKDANIVGLLKHENFRFLEANLQDLDLASMMNGTEVIFHLAAQAGVRSSWGVDFRAYAEHNITATQKILESVKSSQIKKFIFASSSSVYGDIDDVPMKETSQPKPISPYGVTKLTAEHLCKVYHNNFGVPIVALRFFTVYGPRQRPDMAINRFIRSILNDREITIYGSGEQRRDFTYVSDIVDANILAMNSELSGEIFNIGSGSNINIKQTIATLEKLIGKKALVRQVESQKGDMKMTVADISKAQSKLGYNPSMPFKDGLVKEIDWIKRESRS